MPDVDPSDAMRDLKEARTAGQEATTALMTGRWRWAALGAAVFAGSVLARLTGPESSDFLPLVLLPVAVVALVLSYSPKWGWLTGRRARLTGAAGWKARLLTLLTMLGALALYLLLDTAMKSLAGGSYPVIAGAVAGLVLALAGPPLSRWWLAMLANRR